MLIYCPKCKIGYDVDEKIVAAGKKVRCANCGHIFAPQDYKLSVNVQVETYDDDIDVSMSSTVEKNIQLQPVEELSTETEAESVSEMTVENESEKVSASEEEEIEVTTARTPEKEPDEIKDIFARLSEQTESLFTAEAAMPAPKKLWYKIKSLTGLNNPANYKYYILTIFMVLGLLFYNYRYEIVRVVPFADYAYRAVGIRATVPGEGLAFQNITRREYEEDYIRHMEVKGFLVNTTAHDVNVPPLHVELLDRDALKIQEITVPAPAKFLLPGGRVAFSYVIPKLSPLTKHIYMTFKQ